MTMMSNEISEASNLIKAERPLFLQDIPRTSKNDPIFKEGSQLLEKPSEAQFLSEFKEIVEAERKKTSACLGRIAHDKTRAQMKLIDLKKTYGIILKSGGAIDEALLKDIAAEKAFIKNCLEQSTLIRDRLLRLESGLKTMLLSRSAKEHPENTISKISNKSIGHSKNRCGFWSQETTHKFRAEQQTISGEPILNNRM